MSYGISQSYLPPDRGSDSRPYPGRIGRYSIYPPIKDERLSRPRVVNSCSGGSQSSPITHIAVFINGMSALGSVQLTAYTDADHELFDGD